MFRRILSVFLSAVLVLSIVASLPLSVNAHETDLQEVGSYADERWQWTDAGVQQERCTYRAWHEAYDRLSISLPLTWGNAATWAANARNDGYSVDNTPSANSIVCWSGYTWGHVAYVTGVDDNNIYIREGGINPSNSYPNYWFRDTSFSKSNQNRWNGYTLEGYIHLGGGGLNFTPVYMGENFCANIIHLDSGKAVAANGDNAGDNVSLQTLDGKLLHKWEFVHQGNNEYKIVNHHSGKCLDVSEASSNNGANVQVFDSNGSNAQLWYFKAVGSGYSLVPKCAPNRSLDILDGNTSDWSNIQIWESWDGSPQIFVLNYLPFFTAQNLGEHFYANIIHLESGKAVVATGDNAGDNVVLSTLDGKLLHKWEFIRQGDWSYKIVNTHSGRCLDVSAASTDNGANVQVWDSNGSDAQLWFFKKVGNGYSLVPKCAHSRSLDILDGVIADGTNIQSWESWDGSPQIFTLNYLPSFVAQNLGERFYANIVHLDSNKPVVAIGDNDGDNVELGEFSGAIIKKWEFIRQNDWSYTIINNHSGKALDVNGGYSENMTNIQVYKPNNSNAQRWYIKEVGNGYSLVPKCALSSALDLENGIAENGTNISLHKQNSSSAQIYYFNLQPSDIALDVGESFDAYIIHSASGLAVSYNAVGNTIVQPNGLLKEQTWHFERQKDMSYIITNYIDDIDEDLFMSVDKQYNHDGANVQINSANGLNGQRWYIIENGSGYSLVPKCAVNRAMDLDGGNTTNSNIQIWKLEHNNPNQIFEISVIEPITYTLGDVDFDGNIEIRDATWIQRSVADIEIPFTISKVTADIDGDDNITVMDATAIQYYLANMKISYKIGEIIE